MARTQRTNLDVRLTATDQTSDALSNVAAALDDLIEEMGGVARAANDVDGSGLQDLGESADDSASAMGKLAGPIGALKNLGSNILGAAKEQLANFGAEVWELYGTLNKSQTKMQAHLNLTQEEARDMRGVVTDVWTEGFGDVETVTEVLIGLRQNIKGLSEEDLQYLTSNVTLMATVFEQDIEKMTGATGALMNEFGLSAEEAMDFVAAGFTRGLDSAGDFLDTVNEYSNLFEDAGFSAGQFFAILEAGQKTGVLGVDKIADVVKEGYLRFMEGSDEYLDTLVEAKFEAEGNVAAYYNMGQALQVATKDMEHAEVKTSEWEEKLAAASEEARGLKTRLDEANRTLKEMARPKLKGAEAYDNKLFELGQRAKELKLAMLDVPKDSAQYDRLAGQLEGVNAQMEKVSLQRDIDLEPKYRALEKSVAAVETQHEVSFDQAMQNVENQKKEVHKLAGAYDEAKDKVSEAGYMVGHWSDTYTKHADKVEAIKSEFRAMRGPANDLIQQVRDGEKTFADVLPQILDWVEGIEDPVTRAAVATELFGSPIEDLGVDAALAAMRAGTLEVSMEDLSGSMNETRDNATDFGVTLTSIFNSVKAFLAKIIDQIVVDISNMFGDGTTTSLTSWLDSLKDADIEAITANITTHLSGIIEWLKANGPSMFNSLKEGFGGFISWVQTNLPGILDTLKEVGSVIGSIFGSDDAEVPGQLEGLQKIGPVLNDLSNSAEVFGKFEDLSKVGSIVGKFSNSVGTELPKHLGTAKRAFDMLKVVLHTIGNAFRIVKEIISALLSVITTIVAIVANLIAVFNGTITPGEAMKNIIHEISTIFVHLGNAIGTAVDTVWELVSAFGAAEPPEWLSNAGGWVAEKIGIPGFADGGNFTGNKPMIVGERGPELMIPKRGGSVVPNTALAGMGNNTINITVQGNANADTVAQMEQVMNRALDRLVRNRSF